MSEVSKWDRTQRPPTPPPERIEPLSARRRGFLALSATMSMFVLTPRIGKADPLLTFPLRIKGHALRVELANTPDTRRIGLMNRRQLGENSGMLFVFDAPSRQAMWMKNTLIPLSVAFVGTDGRILNIEDMQPLTEDAHASDGEALYAIETNVGWFRTRKIGAGARVEGLKEITGRR